ncbi:MAG: GNAT family N-acetyltransferase [Acidobacteriota bacterium]
MTGWRIEPLNRDHIRSSFDCGNSALDEFIRLYARQQQDKNYSRTFVASDAERVYGFCSLSVASIAFESIPPDLRRKCPRYPVPVACLGRLAVDKSASGRGLGSALLRDALLRVSRLSRTDIGIVAVLAEAKDDTAARFYSRHGFVPLADRARSLFLLVSTIEQAVAAGDGLQ